MPENIEKKDEKPKKTYKKRILTRIKSNLTDGDLINKSRVWTRMLEDNLAAFAALDSTFNPAFIAAWGAEIEALEQLPTSERCEDWQQVKYGQLQDKRLVFSGLLYDLDYYITKAFPKADNRYEEFGLHKLRTQSAKRGVRDVVIGFATLQRIEFYQTQLLAAGMPAGFIATFDAALGDYADAEVQHQYSLLESIRYTNERIKAFNVLYARHRIVVKAAEAVFDGDEIKINLFR